MYDFDKYFEVLGLEPGASQDEIKQAYRDLAKVWRPDRFRHESPRLQEKAQEKLKEINEAYDKLKSYHPGSHEKKTESEPYTEKKKAERKSDHQKPRGQDQKSHSNKSEERSSQRGQQSYTMSQQAGEGSGQLKMPTWLIILIVVVCLRLLYGVVSGPTKTQPVDSGKPTSTPSPSGETPAPTKSPVRELPAPTGAVNDFAGVITPEKRSAMSRLSKEVLEKMGTAIVVATFRTVGDNDPDQYANRLYENWGIGKKGGDKGGILIFLTLKERRVRIETGYGVEGIITDSLAGQILDSQAMPYLKEGDYGKGLYNAMIAISEILSRNANVTLEKNLL